MYGSAYFTCGSVEGLFRSWLTSDGNPFRVALVLALVWALAMPLPVIAADHVAACDPNDSGSVNQFKGELTRSGAEQGIRANLEGQSLDLCTGAGTNSAAGSFAFVNIVNDHSTWNIVQIGLGQCRDSGNLSNCNYPTTGMSYYWAWGRYNGTNGCAGRDNVPPIPQRLGSWSGATVAYIVTHESTWWNGYIAGTKRASVSEGNICLAPNAVEWSGRHLIRATQLAASLATDSALLQQPCSRRRAEHGPRPTGTPLRTATCSRMLRIRHTSAIWCRRQA